MHRAWSLGRSLSAPGLVSLPLDLIEVVCTPAADARASAPRLAPTLLVQEVARPERPGAALHRPDRVHRAAGQVARFERKEDAVPRPRVFAQALPAADLAGAAGADLGDVLLEELSQPAQFIFLQPDVPGRRPGAALPAAQAFKRQPAGVPRLWLCHAGHGCQECNRNWRRQNGRP